MNFPSPVAIKWIAELIGASLYGNSNGFAKGINEIHKVEEGDLVFVDHQKYYQTCIDSPASFIIIDQMTSFPEHKAILVVEKPFEAYLKIVKHFMPFSPAVDILSKTASIGEGTYIAPGAFIGNHVSIGKNCIVQPNVSVMDYSIIGDNVIMANGASLAGHVHLNSNAILGGFTLVHQFTQVGQYSFAAMGSAITQDIPPFIMVGGKPTRPHGINSVGMERNGISAEDIRLIRNAYKIVYKMNLRLEDAIEQLEEMAEDSQPVADLIAFLRNVSRGILR